MTREFETGDEGQPNEPRGLPTDLLTDPAKYDGAIPHWKRTVVFVKQYETAKPKGRESLLDQASNSIVRDPATLIHLLNNFDLVGQLQPDLDIVGIKEQLVTHAEQAMARRSNLASWTPTKIEGLIRLELDNRQREVSKPPTPRTSFPFRGLIGDLMGHHNPTEDKVVGPLSPLQRLESALFNAPQSLEEAIDLHYNASWAMVATAQSDVREELFSILCYEKDWFPVDSLSAFLFAGPGSIFADDSHLSKSYAANDAIKLVGCFLEFKDGVMPINPSRIGAKNARTLEMAILASNNPRLSEEENMRREKLIMHLIRSNGARYQAFQQHNVGRLNEIINPDISSLIQDMSGKSFKEKIEELKAEKQAIKRLPWPTNVIRNPDEPLRKMVEGQFNPMLFKTMWEDYVGHKTPEGFIPLVDRPIQITESVDLDIIAKGYISPEQKQNVVRQVLEVLISGGILPSNSQFVEGLLDVVSASTGLTANFDQAGNIRFALWPRFSDEIVGALSSIIEIHRPNITHEQLDSIITHLSTLRQEIKTKFTKSVGRRGYGLLIADPALYSFGYQLITFKQAQGSDIRVSLLVDGQEYSFSLDPEYRIKLGEDIKRFQSSQDQGWLELLTLSHLKKLICTGEDDEELKAELLGGEKQLSRFRKQMVHRGEHLRKLPPGQKYSPSAFELCLKSHLPVPPSLKRLDIINEMRAERGWGGTLETGMWTYVSGVERDIDTQVAKPVRVAFAHASDDIRKVIDLGAVSKEELDRLQKETLADLERE